jgi:hypothetical protein
LLLRKGKQIEGIFFNGKTIGYYTSIKFDTVDKDKILKAKEMRDLVIKKNIDK